MPLSTGFSSQAETAVAAAPMAISRPARDVGTEMLAPMFGEQAPQLQCALLLAWCSSGHIEGMPLGPDLPDLRGLRHAGELDHHRPEHLEELADEAHRRFDDFMTGAGVAGFARDSPARRTAGRRSVRSATARWRATGAFDVTRVGAGAELGHPRMATAEADLWKRTPGPCAPQDAGPLSLANQSTETARAVAMGMPLLRQAKRVVVLTVENFMVEIRRAKPARRCCAVTALRRKP